jgi:hypothetical protein
MAAAPGRHDLIMITTNIMLSTDVEIVLSAHLLTVVRRTLPKKICM